MFGINRLCVLVNFFFGCLLKEKNTIKVWNFQCYYFKVDKLYNGL